MKTIAIAAGITLTASQSTIAAYERELARIAAEERWYTEALSSLMAWLADPANTGDPEYSDIYKDVYGFRPRR